MQKYGCRWDEKGSTFPTFKGKCSGCGARGHICSMCPKLKAEQKQAALACAEEESLNKSYDKLGFIVVQQPEGGRYNRPKKSSEKRVWFCRKHIMLKSERKSSCITDFKSCKRVKKAIWKNPIEIQDLDSDDDWDGSVVVRKGHWYSNDSEGFSNEKVMVSTFDQYVEVDDEKSMTCVINDREFD